jgi:hypothetical protein
MKIKYENISYFSWIPILGDPTYELSIIDLGIKSEKDSINITSSYTND